MKWIGPLLRMTARTCPLGGDACDGKQALSAVEKFRCDTPQSSAVD
jgi:hypothetical protein